MEQNPDFAVVGPMNYGIVEDEFEPAFRSMIQRDTTYLQDRAAGRAQRFYPLRYVIGCGILMRCATLKRVGLFDPAYITYGEETDLCTRIRFHGGKVMLDTNARLWHLADKPFNPRIAFFATRGAAMNILKRPDRPLLSRILHTQRYLGGIMGRSIRGAADSFQSWPVVKAALWVNFFLPRILIRRRRELRLALPEGEFSFKPGLWPRARQEREP
jgi:GT2 family glycosyltransferase